MAKVELISSAHNLAVMDTKTRTVTIDDKRGNAVTLDTSEVLRMASIIVDTAMRTFPDAEGERK